MKRAASMPRMLLPVLLPTLMAAMLQPVQAAPPQTVYRCGPDGRVYSQAPCADGKPLSVEDPRSASQQRAAREVAARDAEQAKQLADERRQREQAAQGQAAAGFKTAPTPPSAGPDAGADAAKGATAGPRKPKSKARAAPAADPRMSPPMRVPTAASAPR
jgi:hypothetical protein